MTHMEQTFLSIKDFAARAGVSAQAIYKRLNNPVDELTTWLKIDGKRKMLDIQALSLFQSTQVDNQVEQPVVNPIQPVDNRLIEMLQAELAAKNAQIERLQDQVTQAHQLLSQEQQLRAVAEQRILMLESGQGEQPKSEPEPAAEAAQDEPIQDEPQPSRPWWKFWK